MVEERGYKKTLREIELRLKQLEVPEPLRNLNLTRAQIEGITYQDKFADNAAVGTSFEDIWNSSSALTYLTSASTITVTSSGNDNGAGSTGAQSITIEGLDGNWDVASETIATLAATPPVTTQTFLRVNRAYVVDVGAIASGTNENNIVLTATTGGSVQGQIGAGLGQTEKSQYAVPRNFTAYISKMYYNMGKGDDGEVTLDTRNFGEAWRVKRLLKIYQSEIDHSLESYIPVNGKSDIRQRAKSSAGGVQVASGYDFILVPDA